MTTSQFTIYRSTDVGAPVLKGTSGSLVAIFDACLINGYGSQAPAGWTQPIPHESSSHYLVSGSVDGCYQNISGSGMTLYVNDDRPNGSSTFREAWATGWETLSSMSLSDVGVGSGQFPTPAQLLTTGHVVIRKSTSADATARAWMMFADEYTFYFYAETGDGMWYPFWFGDIYSLKSSGSDLYRCVIKGRAAENTGAGVQPGTAANDSFAAVGFAWSYSSQTTLSRLQDLLANGTYMARTFGGGGTSIACGMLWDAGKSYIVTYGGGYSSTQAAYWMVGSLSTPNMPDNALYIEPFYITEQATGQVRGRFRGIYRLCHYGSIYSTGQILHGAGDYAGKDFMVIRGFNENTWYNWSVVHLIEVTNTVETND